MRRPDGRVLRAAVFLGVVLLVAVGTSAGPYLAQLGGEQPEPANYSEYAASSIVPEQIDAEGRPAVEPRDDRGVVVIDESHGNRLTRDGIQPLVAAITDAGYRVEFLSDSGGLDDALGRADAFVVVDPGQSYSQGEADRIERFVDSGGRLVMLGEPTTLRISQGVLGIALTTARNRLSSLSTRFGIEFGTDYLYNMERNDGNFRNVPAGAAADDPVVEGVDRATVYTGTQVSAPNGTALLVAPDGTRTARGDDVGEYALAVRSGGGSVLAVGDTTFLERANYNVLDNEQLVANVAGFLVDGEPERTLREYPAVVDTTDSSPTVAYTSPELLDATQRLGRDLGGRNPDLTLATGGVPTGADVLVTTYGYLETKGVDGTGIALDDGNVSVPGYESNTTGVIVIRAPDEGRFDLVIAADSPDRVGQAADVLAGGNVEQYTVADRTAVLRTGEAGSG